LHRSRAHLLHRHPGGRQRLACLVRTLAQQDLRLSAAAMGNWERLVWNQREALLAGLTVTVEICLIAFVLAVAGGLLLCLVRMYVRPLRPLAIVVIEFFRATPILVQLLWVNYVWPPIFGW